MLNNFYINLLGVATWETFYMVFASMLFAALLGLPFGVLLVLTAPKGLVEHRVLYKIVSWVVNVARSVPFIILLVAILPLTRFIIGTSIGTNAAIVPLSLSAAPFIARIVESALLEVNPGLIEAGHAMGASTWQIVTKILLPESMATIIRGLTLTIVSLTGYSAMAGTIGGGGLGDVAIRYGYQLFNTKIMLLTIIILVVFVQLTQWLGERLARYYSCH